MSFNFALYLPLVAIIVGGLYHSLSDDGGSNLLTHFGVTGKLPPKLLPVVILGFAVFSGAIDAKLGGADWQSAFITAATAVCTGLFGAVLNHSATNKTPPTLPPGAVAMLLAVFLFGASVSCKGGPAAPTGADVEAGAPIAENICQVIEVATGSTVLETICATLPEVALIAETILALRVDSGTPTPAEVCKPVPGTKLCATPREIHAGVQAVLNQRRARLLLDAGLQ